MRVAMVSPYDLGVPGGVQGQVIGLAAALRNLGHEVLVIAPGEGSVADALVVGKARGVRANGSVAPVALSPLAAWRAALGVREGAFDVVHLHEPLAPVVPYGCLLAARQPMVGTFHRSGSSALYRWLAPAARWALRRLAVRCAVSEAARDTVAPVAGGPVEVLFNGIDLERFRVGPSDQSDGPTVLFLGRHEPRKGLAVLLDAVSRMRKPPVVWVAGDGPATAELMARYPPSSRLVWLGRVSEEDKLARLGAADIFCAPSIGGESFGVVLLEAMAARCAVVASDIDGYRQAAGGHARLVRPLDPTAWAAALDEAIADATSARGRSAPGELDGARRYVEQWSMDELAQRYVAIYEGVSGAGPAVA